MIKFFRSAVLALLLVPSAGTAQDLDAGMNAAQAGDFAPALRECKPFSVAGSRLRPDLHPATWPEAAQPAKLRASPRCPTRSNGQNSNPEPRSRWIKLGGSVKARW